MADLTIMILGQSLTDAVAIANIVIKIISIARTISDIEFTNFTHISTP
ncbi:hypothetical protein CCACVL1_18465 [Corchorus capsularis]|uniref:Uncharacterized protein n=1 Tax=Corchorus capsularis TaxID=210143 RepID=A0A1R3HLC8_COCAP|nr:hypothetical protein CCACVL1_18465 [Corchorus capsularis]